MTDAFSADGRRALEAAADEARRRNHVVGSPHLLLGVIADPDSPASRALARMGLSREAVRREVERSIGRPGTGRSGAGDPELSSRARGVLEQAQADAAAAGVPAGSHHLLLALVGDGEGRVARLLKRVPRRGLVAAG